MHFALGPLKAGLGDVRFRFVISGGSGDGARAGPLPGLRAGASLLPGRPTPLPGCAPPPRRLSLDFDTNASVHLPVENFTLRPYLQDGVTHLVLGWSLPPLLFQALGLQEALGGGFLWVYFYRNRGRSE